MIIKKMSNQNSNKVDEWMIECAHVFKYGNLVEKLDVTIYL